MKRQEQLNNVLWHLLDRHLQEVRGWTDDLGEGMVTTTFKHRFKVEFNDATYVVKVTKKQVVR